VSILWAACGSSGSRKPDIPDSVSPGWKLNSIAASAVPAGVPADGSPDCWKADYSGQGSANVWLCWYKATANAFDAVQRARAEAQTVKFQEDHYLVLVSWNNAPKANLTALIRALQKSLQPK
jgi:hypothetical protein